MSDPIHQREIVRYVGNARTSQTELLARETIVEVFLEGHSIALLHCSPGQEEELARGHLYAKGLLRNPLTPAEIRMAPDRMTVSFLSSLAGAENSPPDNPSECLLDTDLIYGALAELEDSQSTFKKTGATHASMCHSLDSSESYFAEDISRHNAMSKAIGAALIDGAFPDSCLLLTTGRLTGSLVHSCSYANLAAVASKAVATTEGIAKARSISLTLIGSLSSSGFWLYHEGTTKIV